jgi:hypothetical protein
MAGGGALPQLARRGEQTVADCAALSGDSALFAADLEDEARHARAAAARGRALSRHRRRGAQRGALRARRGRHLQLRAHGAPCAQQHRRGHLLAQALHEHLAARDAQGAVVHLLDQKLWNPNPDFLSYTLSKAALEAATPMLALALAPRVRVVGVAPGLTLASHMLDDDTFAQLHKLSPLGRSSTPEDVVATVKFALENRSLTGTTLLVDGGQHLMKFERDFSLM